MNMEMVSFETILGPTASDLKKLLDIITSMNEPKKSGKKGGFLN